MLEAPKCNGIVLHHSVDWGKKIRHALYVAQVAVVLVVGEEHVFHLLQMDIGAHVCERRGGIRVWRIFTREEGYCAIGSMDVFLCCQDPKEWDSLAYPESFKCGNWCILPIRPFCSRHHSPSSPSPPRSISRSHHAPFNLTYSSRRLAISAFRSSAEDSQP